MAGWLFPRSQPVFLFPLTRKKTVMRRRAPFFAEAWKLLVGLFTVRLITRHFRGVRRHRAAGWR